MKYGCHNPLCEFYLKVDHVIKDGSYYRKDDSRQIMRFKCKACLRRFSSSSHTPEWKQKKRRVNHMLYKLLASGVSMRRSALILNVHHKTIHRKLIYLASKARLDNAAFLKSLENDQVQHMQFDDLITTEHTKLKPLSVSVAVDAKRRFILGVEVGSIPAFGHLAALSRKKYGKRKNEHKEKLHDLFSKLEQVIHPFALIESDEHHQYAPVVAAFFSQAKHVQYKGARGAIVGQGELKKLRYDPLFKLNHTCAMFRANVNRLFRRTWCTTKNPEMLKNHIDLYIHFHNNYLI